jgi:hypothetical protein
MKRRVILLIAMLALPTVSSGKVSDTKLTPALRAYLQKTLYDPYSTKEDNQASRVSIAELELKNGRRQVLVYMTGEAWCGSGGCTLLILEQHGASFRELGHTPTVRLPIRELTTSSNGRLDLGVWEADAVSAYEQAVRFNGWRYRRDDMPLRGKHEGRLLIDKDNKGEPLY